MNLATICIFTLFAVSLAAPHQPLKNITITVPQGTSNHSDPHLLCTPADGYDVALFIFANYVVHVATIVTLPGETLGSIFLTMIFALIYPMTGIQKCIRLLGKHTLLCRDQSPLNIALRAGALCEVVRTADWKPEHGNKIYNAKVIGLPTQQECQNPNAEFQTDIELQRIDDQAGEPARQRSTTKTTPDLQENSAREETCHAETSSNTEQSGAIEPHSDHNPSTTSDERSQFAFSVDEVERFAAAKNNFQYRGRAIHGRCSIPTGYALSVLPTNATVSPLSEISNLAHSSDLSSSYNVLGIFAAIFQLFSGSFTLYRTRGDQLERYGSTAFGLTVAPYVIMSFMNLLTLLVTPRYSKLFLVQTSVMKEARLQGGFFEGEVGKIPEEIPAPKRDELSIRFITLIAQPIRTYLLRIFSPTMSKRDTTTSGDIEFRGSEANALMFTSVEPERQTIWLSINGAEKIHPKRNLGPSARQLVEIPASPVIRPTLWLRNRQKQLFIFLSILLSCISLLVIGFMSHFKQVGEEYSFYREFVMRCWLVIGIVYAAVFIYTYDFVLYRTLSRDSLSWYKNRRLLGMAMVSLLCFFAGSYFTVHELVYVCKELLEYGSCVRLF